MRLREFIRENREDLDAAIRSVPGMDDAKLNDTDREEWVRNDESLYLWARRCGVPL